MLNRYMYIYIYIFQIYMTLYTYIYMYIHTHKTANMINIFMSIEFPIRIRGFPSEVRYFLPVLNSRGDSPLCSGACSPCEELAALAPLAGTARSTVCMHRKTHSRYIFTTHIHLFTPYIYICIYMYIYIYIYMF